jgi:hypothetical protein
VAVVPLETFKTYIESTSTNKNQLQELTQVQKKIQGHNGNKPGAYQ